MEWAFIYECIIASHTTMLRLATRRVPLVGRAGLTLARAAVSSARVLSTSAADSHDDFKPKSKVKAEGDELTKQIDEVRCWEGRESRELGLCSVGLREGTLVRGAVLLSLCCSYSY